MANTIAETGVDWAVGDVFELDSVVYVVIEVGVYALRCGVVKKLYGFPSVEGALVSCGKLHRARRISVSVPVGETCEQYNKS
jgi:hypothetical protein